MDQPQELFARHLAAWNLPRNADVIVEEFCFSTPRIIMHKCCASITTPTPCGCSTSINACATCSVKRSCTCRRRANTSTIRGSFDNPMIRPFGGGLAEVVEEDEHLMIRGYSCPLASVVAEHPKACVIAEELLSGIVGVPVKECCDKNSSSPKCLFRIEVKQ